MYLYVDIFNKNKNFWIRVENRYTLNLFIFYMEVIKKWGS